MSAPAAAHTPTWRDPHDYRWIIFFAMAGVYCTFGVMVMSIPPMVSEVRADLGVGRGAMGLALGAWAFIFIFTAPPAGKVIDRLGLRWSLTLGAAFIAASGFARAAAQDLGSMWLAIAIFGIGGPLVSTSAPKLASVWFRDMTERRLAVGVYAAAPAVGSILALTLTNAVLLPWLDDWRKVVLVDSAFAVATGVVWLIVATLAPPEPEPQLAGPGTSEVAVGGGMWRTLRRDPGVRLALVLGVGTFFVNHGLSAWLPDALGEEVGLSPNAASNVAAAGLVLGVVANLLLPRAASDERRNRVLGSVMGVMAAALAVMVTMPQVVAVAAGLVVGIRAVLVPLVILVLMSAPTVGTANMGAANGIWFAFAEVGGTTGPVAVGAIGDSAVGYTGAMLVLACVLVALMAFTEWDSARRSP